MRRLIEIITGQINLNYVQSKIYPGVVGRCAGSMRKKKKHLSTFWMNVPVLSCSGGIWSRGDQ